MTKLVSASALALLAISATSPVFAADGTPVAPQDAHSTAKVGIEEGTNTDPTNPADPMDPDNPVDPGDPTNPGTGFSGPLSIDFVSNLDFGSKELNPGGTTEFGLDEKAKPTVQVTDKRNTGAGWTLSVRLAADATGTPATDMDTVWTSATDKLKGAVLTLPEATSAAVAANNQSAAPSDSEITSVNGSSQVVTTADKDQGMGSWRSNFDNAGVKLTVPAGNKAGDYTANLTWELVDAAKA